MIWLRLWDRDPNRGYMARASSGGGSGEARARAVPHTVPVGEGCCGRVGDTAAVVKAMALPMLSETLCQGHVQQLAFRSVARGELENVARRGEDIDARDQHVDFGAETRNGITHPRGRA